MTAEYNGYEGFYATFFSSVRSIAQSLNIEDPENFSQEVMTKALENWGKLQGIPLEEQKSWINRVVRNQRIDRYRHQARNVARGDAGSLEAMQERESSLSMATAPDVAEQVVEKDTLRRLAQKVEAALTPTQKEGLRRAKDAREQHLPVDNTTRQQLFAARVKVRQIIAKDA